jgi:hypothetical protein
MSAGLIVAGRRLSGTSRYFGRYATCNTLSNAGCAIAPTSFASIPYSHRQSCYDANLATIRFATLWPPSSDRTPDSGTKDGPVAISLNEERMSVSHKRFVCYGAIGALIAFTLD